MTDESASHSDTIRVLHVDDEPDFAELAAEFMRRQDDAIQVETETDAEVAIGRLRDAAYDCVVSDFDMPGLTGIDLLEAVRERDPELPFILFTGKGSEEIASEAVSKGVTDYLQKQRGSDQYALLVNRIRNAVDRSRAHEAVAETEQWARTLLEHSSDFLFVVDGSGTISYVSPSVERVLGYDPAELDDENAFEFVHPEDLQNAGEAFETILESPDREVRIEYRAFDASGDIRWLEVRGRNLLDDEVVEGILVNVRDITERQRNEREREQAVRRYEALLENANDAIVRVDFEGDTPIVKEYNDTFASLFVPDGTDAVGRDIDEVVAGEARREDAREVSRRVRAGESIRGRLTRDTVDGPREFLWQAVPIESDTDGPTESGFAIYTPLSADDPIE